MEAVPLFLNKKEILWSLFVLILLFFVSLGWQFYHYRHLVAKPLHVEVVKVLNHYQKYKSNGRAYDVFKLKSDDGYTFYTVSWSKRDIPVGSRASVEFKTDKITFLKYLKNFFAVSIYIKPLKQKRKNYLDKIKKQISNQHKTKEMKQIYEALFFASNISKNTRDKIQKLGISHLVAISGFHLGLISAILYFLFAPVYRFFQDRYFPYRNIKADLAFVVFALLFGYMYILDFSPSFLRSFVLSLFGFFLFSKNIKIISFATLFLSVFFILILFPRLIFSVSFWFSVSGVFYIFLFLKHFANLNRFWIFVLLNFWVFILMIPVVHFIFPIFTPLQLFSPILSMLFVPFYPLELFLHLINCGGIFDGGVEWLLNLQATTYEITTPLWFLILYLFLSIASIQSRWVALLLLPLAFAIYLI